LDDVVTELVNPRKDISGEFLVSPNSRFGRGYSNMSFIYANSFGFRRTRVLKGIAFIGRRIPEASIVDR